MRVKEKTKSMKYLFAAIAAVMFLTCYLPMQPAISKTLASEDGRDLYASVPVSERIELAKPGNNVVFSKYTVRYHPNGGKGKTIEVSVDAGTEYTIKDQGYIRDYYAFDGWNSKSDGLGTNYSNEEAINVINDITLYAKWSPRI